MDANSDFLYNTATGAFLCNAAGNGSGIATKPPSPPLILR